MKSEPLLKPGPYHEGSLAVQDRTGERDIAASRGAMIYHTLSVPAQDFLAQQRVVAVGAADASGNPWASLWLGAPGFATAVNDQSVHLRFDEPIVSPDDPIRAWLAEGASIGILAIDLHTRRRLRINGVIADRDATGITIATQEVFPNCPKYIQRREWTASSSSAAARGTEQGQDLDQARQALIGSIDTLFVASRHPTRGVDVSHRGGGAGFVRVLDAHTLRIPDYPGNSMFQTLGNFNVDPRAGVLMVDFEHGRFLSITGSVEVTYGTEHADHTSGGTGRYWQLDVQRWVEFPMRADFRGRLIESSPFNPPTPDRD